ncbi:hypothetical protein A9Q83_11610 [Alphaproteobacteria bacterium 46_93_T64]|nr:hypothetical protein A9Q83_11610 [Alphaproteobacteria bacterium 46_93_T64]
MDILVIDDDEVDFLHIKRLLKLAFKKQELNINWVQNPANHDVAHEIATSEICLIDQNIGMYSGIDLINKSQDTSGLIPMILLTGQGNTEIDRQASEVGASDYLVKEDLTPELLNRSIRFSIAQKQHERKLTKLAFTDGLTRVANRAKFDETLELALYARERVNKYLALFIIDLDDFKLINDSMGHPAGDALLIEISKRLQDAVRRTDTVARLGGDEFGIIIDGYKNEEDVFVIRDKILEAFNAPIPFNKETLNAKASIGVVVLAPGQAINGSEEALQAADMALYVAKRSGKNSCEFYGEEKMKILEQQFDIQKALTTAVSDNELELFFQPKVSVADHIICGAEALLRWNRKDGQEIGPSVFIPFAEKSSNIIEIGRWVIEEACRKLKSWIDMGMDVVPIAVNVSAIQIRSDTFVPHIEQTLSKFSIDPSLLELEITETALMENLPTLNARLLAISNLGCKVVIDDFGVGHSSLSRLQDLPVSKIKIDRSFIAKIESSETSLKICNIVILLAKELNLQLVIEGIENWSQIELLSLTDEILLQGFLFSKPLPDIAFQEWLKGGDPKSTSETDLVSQTSRSN